MTTIGGGAPGGGFGGPPGGSGGKKNRNKNKKKADEDDESSEEEVQTSRNQITLAPGQPGVDANVLSQIQAKLGSLGVANTEFFDSLPEPVKNRVYVLKNLHDERKQVEGEFKKEYEALLKKYRELYQPIYEKRTAIVTGAVEPSIEEVVASKTRQDAKEKEKREQAGLGPKDESKTHQAPVAGSADIKGVPGFWLEAIRHHVDLRDLVEDDDGPALMYLTDIRWRPLDENPASFVLEFHFAENPFFEELVLAKTYHINETSDTGDLTFQRVESPTITWKPNKNLCVKQVTKTQKKQRGSRNRGKGGQTRTVTVEEPTNSFFHFFNPEAFLNLQPDLEEDDYEQFLEDDYVMGTEIKEKLIPYAVLYYTGEMEQEEEYDDGDDDEDDDDDGGDDDDLDDEDDEDDRRHGSSGQGGAHGAQKPECNQQ